MMQKITVIGTGYVGLIAGLGFAKWGNEVGCLDVIPEKIQKLQQGICPIYEPGAEVQLSDGLTSGRLRFTCDVKEAVEHGELIFIAVGTPEAPDGSADMKYVYSAVDEIADYMQSYKLVVDKSTVPVGTSRALKERMAIRLARLGKDIPFDVASNPEFLRKAVRWGTSIIRTASCWAYSAKKRSDACGPYIKCSPGPTSLLWSPRRKRRR